LQEDVALNTIPVETYRLDWIDPATVADRNASYAPDNNNRGIAWTLAHQWNLPYGQVLRWGSNAGGVQQAVRHHQRAERPSSVQRLE